MKCGTFCESSVPENVKQIKKRETVTGNVEELSKCGAVLENVELFQKP